MTNFLSSSGILPIIFLALLLFGAADGNFYGLRLSDGSLAWKTKVDPSNFMQGENLPAQAKFNSAPAASSVQVDPQTGRVFWCFAVTQTEIEGINGNDMYTGILCSLDLSNGGSVWSEQLVQNGSVSTSPPKTPVIGLAVQNGSIYLTAGGHLWTFNESIGGVLGIEHYEHYILPPVVAEGKVFVAADLFLAAYQ